MFLKKKKFNNSVRNLEDDFKLMGDLRDSGSGDITHILGD